MRAIESGKPDSEIVETRFVRVEVTERETEVYLVASQWRCLFQKEILVLWWAIRLVALFLGFTVALGFHVKSVLNKVFTIITFP